MFSEQEIFEELSTLCAQKGFIHTLIEIWFEDNYYRANKNGNLTTSQIIKLQVDCEKLNRNELNTLLALLVKNNPNFFKDTKPSPEVSAQYSIKAKKLLKEFHSIFINLIDEKIFENISKNSPLIQEQKELPSFPKESDVFLNEHSIREAIFYSGDGVYDFQYQDLGCSKYINDDSWFIKNKKFSVIHAHFVIEAIFHFHHQKIGNLLETQQQISLEAFIYYKDEFIDLFEKYAKNNPSKIDFPIDEIESFILAFSFDLANLNDLNKFQKFDDFNPLVAFPFIQLPENKFLLLDCFTLSQAFYETPFFWLSSDKEYKNIASENRGKFTECITYSIFCDVFGKENVWLNIDLYKKSSLFNSSKNKIGEIDILVNLYGYALVFQAKSKKLTLNARKGNIQQIDSDFSKSIQHAYTQAFECSQILLSNDYVAKVDEQIIKLPKTDFCIPICVLSEHFPALTMQIRWLLQEKQHEKISSALVLDVFLLDLMYKTLSTPAEFIHFIHSLSNVREKFLAYTQIDLLAVHLSKNLLCSEDADMFFLDNGFSAELDQFLMQHRRGFVAQKKEMQSLSCWYRFYDTYWWEVFKYCSTLDTKEKFKLGLELLQCSAEFIEDYNSIVSNRITQLELKPTQIISDFTIILSNNHGITVYICNSPFVLPEIQSQIYAHACLRKYNAQSDLWFALIISIQGIVKHISVLDFKWEFNADMQKKYQETLGRSSKPKLFINGKPTHKKIGRNEPCPCKSGKKYKRCCLNNSVG